VCDQIYSDSFAQNRSHSCASKSTTPVTCEYAVSSQQARPWGAGDVESRASLCARAIWGEVPQGGPFFFYVCLTFPPWEEFRSQAS
jgi:hypothetical protein